MDGIWASFPVDLVAAGIVFILGLLYPVIPKSLQAYYLRRFWGKGVQGRGMVICYGGFTKAPSAAGISAATGAGDIAASGVAVSQSLQGVTGVQAVGSIEPPSPEYQYVKRYHDGREIRFQGPWENVLAVAEIRGASYIINTISKFRKEPVPVIVDEDVLKDLNRTIVALGSSSSNDMTDLILREQNNTFLDFTQENETVLIRDKRTGKTFTGFQEPVKQDLGIVLKIRNQRFPSNFFFVCAGLGEWGTSGAAWYLATKWCELQKEFDDSFGIIVEVELHSDQSARRVFPT